MSDIIVIGGGIAGISVAARLSEHAKVTVLEGESALGYHASGRSAALFEKSYGPPTVVQLNHASADYLSTENGGYLSDRGFLLVGRTGQDAQFEADAKTMRSPEISLQEARNLVPILSSEVTRTAWHADAYDIDTDRMIQDFASFIRKNGGTVHLKAQVTSIEFENGNWRVQCGAQEFHAKTLVNAAGAWADQVAQMAGVNPVGITPYRRSMAQVPAPGGHDVSRWPIFFGVNEAWYAKPDAGKLLISPADADATTPHDAYADDMVLAEGIDRYQQCVTEEITRVETTWAGLRSFAPDGTLVLGRDPTQPAFVWCVGQGGYGFQTAAGASQLLSDVVLGRQSEFPEDLVTALSPARFAR